MYKGYSFAQFFSSMELREIGIVRHDFSDDYVRDHMGKVRGTLEVYEEYSEGLYTLEKYEHIFVISIFHKHLDEPYPLRIKPRLLLRKGYRIEDLPDMGVFASDSPSRPNPIGLTLLRMERINGRFIEVSGLDLFDGTPIADIKPYADRYSVRD